MAATVTIEEDIDDDLPDGPDLPEEKEDSNFGDTLNSAKELDVFKFFNILQSPYQNLFIDIRSKDKYTERHPRYSVNIPIETTDENMTAVLRDEIKAQQNIIGNIYIYTQSDDDKAVKDHYNIISDVLKNKFLQFPQIFLFNDKSSLLFTKYPFLCINEEEHKESLKEKEEKAPEKVKAFRKLILDTMPRLKMQTGFSTFTERVSGHIEYPDQILNDRLFLGDYNHATRKEVVKNLKITHIVNCTQHPNEFEKDQELNIKYFQIPLYDEDHQCIGLYFEEAIEFIDNAMKDDDKNIVFIHCAAGVSRSSTITIVYLMKCHSMSFDVALQFVQERRSCVNPNEGFRFQLRYFEDNGYKIDKEVLKKELFKFLDDTKEHKLSDKE